MKKRTPQRKTLPSKIVHKQVPLLEFLLENYTSLSRNNIKSLLSNKQVLVNGAPVKQFDYLLYPKDEISFEASRNKVAQIPRFKIIYEDDEIIAVNKEAGLLTIADDKEKEDTLYRHVNDYVRQKDPHARIFVVHRLDKETSGVIIFSKSFELKELLQDRWNNIVSKREYIAVVEGVFSKKQGTRKTYLLPTRTNLMYSTHDKKGQLAITHYEVLAENSDYSLLRVNIETGRKNQIRVHMKDLHHLVVGDDKYGPSSDVLHRLGLHCRVLEFDHPTKDKHFKFIEEPPKSFLDLFNIKKISK